MPSARPAPTARAATSWRWSAATARAATSWRYAALVAGVAMAAVAATHLLDFGAYDLRYGALDANLSVSWSHVLAHGVLALAAAVCVAGAWRARPPRAVWIVSGALFAVLFLDEVSGLHVQVDALRHGKILYAPALLVLVLCVWRLTFASARLASALVAGALLLASYAIHVLEPHSIVRALGWGTGGWAVEVLVALKEGMELAGLLLVLLALCAAAFAGEA
jgi:hypothetical protein